MTFWRKKEVKPTTPAKEDTSRGGFFSTHFTPQTKDIRLRLQDALKLSFQKEMGTLTPINATTGEAMDSVDIQQAKYINSSTGNIPIQQIEYYAGQGFIGWQFAAMLSQNWLIDKACYLPAKDAIRHGWDLNVNDGTEVKPEIFDKIKQLDKKFQLKKNLIEFVKNGRIFGIRHALILIDSNDPDYYFKPFNLDGVRPNSYKGISQIDPYWITPEFDANAASNPAAIDFYEPTYWRVNGIRIHRSHFIILRNGDEVPDILKPSYFYGGIGIPQKIAERVFASERTANEAPLMAMSKRLTSIKVDAAMAMADMDIFREKMESWSALMNNFGVKIIDHADDIQQFDTTLGGLDETIMTQYQLVAAAANIPCTKLLGTTPKGFSATGEYDESSYHEELESLQENDLTPLLERHYAVLARSELGMKTNFEIQWLPVDSPTAKELAETNLVKAQTDSALVATGAIDGYDVRQRIIKDRDSGFTGIEDTVPEGVGDDENASQE